MNLTSRTAESDLTTLCQVGEHSYIRHESVINYRAAQWLDLAEIDKALAGGIKIMPFKQFDSCTDAFLQKVRCGLLTSKFTPKGIKNDCRPLWAKDCPT